MHRRRFQSTLPARGATRLGSICRVAMPISIHAPRTGSDPSSNGLIWVQGDFNPRSPHGERLLCMTQFNRESEFQSTLPARGATPASFQTLCASRISIHAPRTGSDRDGEAAAAEWRYFNPRSPHGERHSALGSVSIHAQFQSTLPARGATSATRWHRRSSTNFNPRSPHGERPDSLSASLRGQQISIHAPRTGSDRTTRQS